MAADVLSYADWIKLTKHITKPRSKELKAVDESLKRYHDFGGGDARWRLEQALAEWKKAQGPGDAWKKSVRNRQLAVEQLTAQLKGGDSEAMWGRVPNFMHHDFEHARLGVVYLLGKMKVNPEVFSLVLEGGLSITGNVLSYYGQPGTPGSTDWGEGLGMKAVDNAQNYLNAVTVAGTTILNAAASSGGELMIDAPTARHAPPFDKAEGPVSSALSQGDGATVAMAPGAQRKLLAEKFRLLFTEFFKKTWSAIVEKLGEPEFYYANAKALINMLCKTCLDATQAGIISGVMDIASGGAQIVNAAIDKFRAWVRMKGVAIMAGHPSVIIDSIRRAMNMSLLQGVYQTLKGIGNLGLTWATWGVSMVVGVIIACLELIVKLVWRLVETHRMRKMFREAAEHWARRNDSDALHKRPFAFHHWFRSYAYTIPAVAVLTLNSGICGDKMVYLSLFQGDGEQISSSEFLRGAAALDHLKPWGVNYLNQCGYQIYSSDPFVSNLLEFIKGGSGNRTFHVDARSKGLKAWDQVSKVLTA